MLNTVKFVFQLIANKRNGKPAGSQRNRPHSVYQLSTKSRQCLDRLMATKFSLPTSGQTVLVIQAHPDDEVFSGGAAIPALVARGVQVILRIVTGGEAAELGANPKLTVAQARAKRVQKLEKSCAALGIASWDWLGEEGRWVDFGGKNAENLSSEHCLSTKDIQE